MSFTTFWTIMPKDTNYMYPLVFGGAMMSEVDLAAATHARMLMHWTNCDKPVTYDTHMKFTARAYSGDTIKFVSHLVEVRDNALKFIVNAYKIALPTEENNQCIESEHIGQHELVFVTMRGDTYTPHKLKELISVEALESQAIIAKRG